MTDTVLLPAVPQFGPSLADCSMCDLAHECSKGRIVLAKPVPAKFNGIMLVGEGPGSVELSRGEPFVGAAGRLLDRLLAAAEIEREECYTTTATLCAPPPGYRGDKAFNDVFPTAIYACLPRLEKEIAHVRPRVIVTLGQTALIAVGGYEVPKRRMVPTNCTACSEDRKIGPALACAVGDCGWFQLIVGEDPDEALARIRERTGNKCPTCSANLKRCRPKRVPCPECKGRKTREENFTTFENDYTLMEIAGGLLDAKKLAAPFSQFGVEWVIPTYHPGFCLKSTSGTTGGAKYGGQFAARACVDHLEKARKYASGHVPNFPCALEMTDQAEDIDAYLAEHGHGSYSIDIETDSEDGAFAVEQVRCVGIRKVGQPNVLVIDTQDLGRMPRSDVHWSQRDGVPPLFAAIARFCEDSLFEKVLQNGHYDRTVMLWFWGIEVNGQVGDTMLAHQSLYPDEPHSLAHIGFTMTDAEAWKPPKKRSGALHFETYTDLCIYNARDNAVTDIGAEVMGADSRARDGQLGRLDHENLRAVYALDMKLLDVAVSMTITGMPIDLPAREAVAIECRNACDKARETMLRELVDDARVPLERANTLFKPHAEKEGKITLDNAVLTWALFDPTGPYRYLATVLTDKKKEPSVAKEALLKLNDKPFVAAALEWKKYEKFLSTFIESEGLRVLEDGRIHPTWRVGGARTGRWTSSPNFQNFPKSMRSMFIAPEGWVIVGADYDQLELRVMATLTGDTNLISRCMGADPTRKLEVDCDPHSYVSSIVFGDAFVKLGLIDDSHVKTRPGESPCKCTRCKRTALRDVCKRVIYGLNYGAGAATVQKAIYDGGYEGPPITIQIIERAVKVIFTAFPQIPVWREQQRRTATRDQEVRSAILARRRIFPLGEIDETVIANFPIQSSAADIVNQQTVLLHERLSAADPEARIIAQVHDALYILAREERAPAVEALTQKTLTTSLALMPNTPEMVFSAGAHSSKNWKDAA